MKPRPSHPPLVAEQRHRMRRFSEEEMAQFRGLVRDGRTGPARALDALWDLVLFECAGVRAGSHLEPFWVQDFSIVRDQAEELLAAMVERRRLPEREIDRIHMLWLNYSPSDYDPANSDVGNAETCHADAPGG